MSEKLLLNKAVFNDMTAVFIMTHFLCFTVLLSCLKALCLTFIKSLPTRFI